MTVADNVASIRAAVLGIDVRESIAVGIDTINVAQTSLQTTFNGLVINAGTSNAEIVVARGGKADLNTRLGLVDAQLADTVQKLTLKTDNAVISKRRVIPALPRFETTTYINNPILPLGNAGSWDAGSMRDMAILYANGKYYMFYTGAITNLTPYTPSIGLATSPDGYAWTKQGKVFDRNVVTGLFDSGGVFSPGVYFENGIFYMYYAGINDPSQWYNGPIKTGLATSPDGITWTRSASNPVLISDQAWEGSQGVYACDVKKVNGRYLMLYTSHSPGTWDIGGATSTDLINWTKLANNPIIVAPTRCSEEPAMVQMPDGTLLCFADELNTPTGVGVYMATDLDGFSWVRVGNVLSNLGNAGAWCSGVLGASSPCMMPDGKILLAINGSTGSDPEAIRKLGIATITPALMTRPTGYTNYKPQNFVTSLKLLTYTQVLQVAIVTGASPTSAQNVTINWPEPWENVLAVFAQTRIAPVSIHPFTEAPSITGCLIWIETLTGVPLVANTTYIVDVMAIGY